MTGFNEDKEKMRDFEEISKEEFLLTYSYLTEKEYDDTLKEVNNQIEKPLNCPNCKQTLTLTELNSKYNNDIYDKWTCEDCSHIIVLDWRLNNIEAEQ
jgi:transposase-like protein